MPKLIRLYIINVLIGFGLAVVFVAMLLWSDVAHLRHLVLDTPSGWLAGLMLVMFNGVVFAGVQFAIVIMRMAEPEDGPRGGTRAPVVRMDPIAIPATANAGRTVRRARR